MNLSELVDEILSKNSKVIGINVLDHNKFFVYELFNFFE